jgi:methionyl-tRNA synthetase
MKRLITTPIYYVNGAPHLGHFYTTVIADTIARYQRWKGEEVFFLTGTDEHGDKIYNKAQEQGKDTQAFTDEMSQKFRDLWDASNISYDGYIRTTNPEHKAFVQYVFETLKNQGDLYEKEYSGLYCVGSESYVKEGDLREGGLCPDHDEKPVELAETNWFFKLSKYKEQILDLVQQDIIKITPESRKNETIELLKNEGFEDLAVTRKNLKWGIEVLSDLEQKIYVWIDALFNYMSAQIIDQRIECEGKTPEEVIESLGNVWPPYVQVLGKDILKFHAVIWPALLLSFGCKPEQLPQNLVIHGFWVSEGRKMSKSIGNVVVPEEVAETFRDRLGERAYEALRYYVLSEIEIGSDGDITTERVEARYRTGLANGLGNTVSRVAGMLKKYGFEEEAKSHEARVNAVIKARFITHMNSFEIQAALKYLWEIMEEIDKGIETLKPWDKMKQGENQQAEVKKELIKWYSVLRGVVDMTQIILPNSAQELAHILDGEKKVVFPR